MNVEWTETARTDFLRAVEVSFDTFGSEAAHRLIDSVERRIEDMASFPNLGSAVPGTRNGERSVRVGVFRIVYQPGADTLIVVAFLHGARTPFGS